MSKNKPIFIATYKTESGDDGVLGYFTKYPGKGELTALFKQEMPSEFITHSGEERRYVWWEVWELEELALPAPIPYVESI